MTATLIRHATHVFAHLKQQYPVTPLIPLKKIVVSFYIVCIILPLSCQNNICVKSRFFFLICVTSGIL